MGTDSKKAAKKRVGILPELKEILKLEGFTGKQLSAMLWMNWSSYRTATRKSAKIVPNWVRSFIIGYEIGKGIRKSEK